MAYVFRHYSGKYIARPIKAKGWPCGHLTNSAHPFWLQDACGSKTNLDNLNHGDKIRIQTTTDDDCEMMYASDEGKHNFV